MKRTVLTAKTTQTFAGCADRANCVVFFFSQKRNLTFITYFARYSNKTVSAIAIKSVMVEP